MNPSTGTFPDPGLQALAEAAAHACGTPVGLVTRIDGDTQRLVARYGVSPRGLLSPPFAPCVTVVRRNRPVRVVDIHAQQEFADDPLVMSAGGLHAYLGVPVVVDGRPAGTLCVLDSRPRSFTDDEAHLLARLAEAVGAILGHPEPTDSHRRRLLVESLPVGYAETAVDGTVLDVNEEFCRIVGMERHEVIGRIGRTLGMVSETQSSAIATDLADLVTRRKQWLRRRRTYHRPDGSPVPLIVTTMMTHDEEDKPYSFVSMLVDDSERTAAVEASERSQERFRQGFMSSPVGMALLTLDQVFVEVNDSLCKTLGYEREELIGRPLQDLMTADDIRDLAHRFALAEDTGNWRWGAERRYKHRDGHEVIARVSATRIDGDGDGALMLAQLDDITEQRRVERELVHRALHDELTGLPNRALLEDRLARAARHLAEEPLALVLIDLDGFDLLNDALGHSAGDEALQVVAQRLEQVSGEQRTVARIGGDEFVVVCAQDEAETLAETIERAVAQPLVLKGEEVVVTASLGITPVQPDAAALDELLRNGAVALRASKVTGKNRHTVYDSGLGAEASRRRGAESALRQILQLGELDVNFQPVWDLRTGQVVGAEALCRPRDPEGAPIPPGLFIDVAEETGRVSEIGSLVLRQALRALATWPADLHVAVNVSAHQMIDAGFAGSVLTEIKKHRAAAHRLVLELTESAFMDVSKSNLSALHELRCHGVGLVVDDFGTRYASMRYVQELPISGLKIDMSFTRGLPGGRQEAAIVRALSSLARDLGLSCVAEGIENQEQHLFLKALGVQGQGYLLGRPCAADEFAQLLERNGQK